MVLQFNPADMKAVDLRNTKAGDILCPLRRGQTTDLWLRLVGDEVHWPILHLTGANASEVWRIHASNKVPTLVVARGEDLQLEVATDRGVGAVTNAPNQLVFTEEGAYLFATLEHKGFTDECYISITDWSIAAAHEVTPISTSFSAWRLVDVRTPTEKRVLFSAGEWPVSAN